MESIPVFPEAFDSFDPLSANLQFESENAAVTPSSPDTTTVPAVLPSRRRKHRRARGGVAQAGVGSGPASASTSGPARETAPWEVDEERDALEKKEEMRKALRDKIKQKQNGRKNRGMREAGGGMREDDGVAGEEGGIMGNLADLLQTAPGSGGKPALDTKMLQEMAIKMGIPPDQIPNKRTLLRRLQGMNMAQLAAIAASKR
jgi:hypothetical protein